MTDRKFKAHPKRLCDVQQENNKQEEREREKHENDKESYLSMIWSQYYKRTLNLNTQTVHYLEFIVQQN